MRLIRPDRKERFALLQIGINDYTAGPLRGCVNDILQMDDNLRAAGWYPSASYRLFDRRATQMMIRTGMRWLMQQRLPVLIMQFSGHGTLLRDDNGDEKSGIDGALCPADYHLGRYIRDDEIAAMEDMLSPGQRLILFLDCCYSGASQRESFLSRLIPWRQTRKRYVRAEGVIPGDEFYDASKGVSFNNEDSILIATARPNELCDDAWIEGQYRGAGTFALMKAWGTLGLKASYEEVAELANMWLGSNGHSHRIMFGGKKENYTKPFLT